MCATARRVAYARTFVRYLEDNFWLCLFVLVVFVAGVVVGALAINGLGKEQQAELLDYLQIFFRDLTERGTPAGARELARRAVINNLKTAGLTWVLGLVVFGAPVVLALVFARGFALGFTVGFLVQEMGIGGVVFALAAIFPQNVFAVPATLAVSVASLSFSLTLVKAWVSRRRFSPWRGMAGFAGALAFTCLLFCAAGLVEGYVAPVFMKLLSPYLG